MFTAVQEPKALCENTTKGPEMSNEFTFSHGIVD
jgi:hypothetical protein